MIKYHQESITFQDLQENNLDRLQLQILPEKKKMLEIGCATGSLSEYLIKGKGCRVLGIEPSCKQDKIANTRGLTVKTGSIDEHHIQADLDREVTHIANFEELLLRFKDWLSPSGVLIISTCDFAFTFEDLIPFKLLYDTRILAPSDLLRLIPFAGKSLRKRYTNLTKNFIATQFVLKATIITTN